MRHPPAPTGRLQRCPFQGGQAGLRRTDPDHGAAVDRGRASRGTGQHAGRRYQSDPPQRPGVVGAGEES